MPGAISVDQDLKLSNNNAVFYNFLKFPIVIIVYKILDYKKSFLNKEHFLSSQKTVFGRKYFIQHMNNIRIETPIVQTIPNLNTFDTLTSY